MNNRIFDFLNNHQRNVKFIFLISILVIHLLPIWAFKYIPTQDGINHIYNAQVLKDYHRPGSYKLRESFEINSKISPNWFSHRFMAMLMHVVSPLTSEKILLSLYLILMPVSFYYFLTSVNQKAGMLAPVGFLFSYNFFLHMGFYNFVMSIPLLLFTTGYWWRHKNNLRPIKIAVLFGLFSATYLCHFMSYALMVFSISFFVLYSLIANVLKNRRKSINETICQYRSQGIKTIFKKIEPLFLLLCLMVPAYYFLIEYYLFSTQGQSGFEYKSFHALVKYFLNAGSLLYFKEVHAVYGRALFMVMCGILGLALWHKFKEAFQVQKEKRALSEILIDGKAQFLILSVFFTIIYFIVPFSLLSGGEWINDRVHIYILLMLMPFLNRSFHPYIQKGIFIILTIFYLWNYNYTFQTYYYLNKDMEDMTASAGILKDNTTLTVWPDEVWAESSYLGELEGINPFAHLPSYLCIGKDRVYYKNYEGLFNYFPVNFKNKKDYWSLKADYALVWDENYHQISALEKEGYSMIYQGKRNRIYQHNK